MVVFAGLLGISSTASGIGSSATTSKAPFPISSLALFNSFEAFLLSLYVEQQALQPTQHRLLCSRSSMMELDSASITSTLCSHPLTWLVQFCFSRCRTHKVGENLEPRRSKNTEISKPSLPELSTRSSDLGKDLGKACYAEGKINAGYALNP
ncbi:hypothetical protein NC653_016688 [Populus alba x Populus x berolinensis]|uniref:Uncharacterized protein n=1 Tax=Populus alba x Populus x berolinensis TaxID=444605 RepID=A0AAD6QNU0_9ROSI|nr:hypothetical protein NC653_016685 [Populus alba x Populus x berolinensis]KAJ6993628.1 hypothetical protein NC653_016688 [Populus alba x Populus x berolinensis]